ncbi:NAD(P)-binding protein [Setomelanomma holmii]|uniref:NAD(P)-binding protein n=1 Tax=Setomelanomma holmii TaxID=210430 RepID=A0A9P4LRY7_9PLEO|nr:NAD(P)-binding protein [Setomelanomma holmii]
MALPLRCARAGAALPVTFTSMRAARLSTSAIARSQINSDVRITRTGKPILTVSGGRSSLGGYTATVFGATGFLGRYIVNRLARSGCTVIVPFREEMAKRHLKVAGDLGRVVFIEMDLRNTASIEESVRHSDIVYNLIGRDYPTKNFSLEDVHVAGTERIVDAVAKYDIDRFVQVSSHSASLDSPSEFYRTKAQGEQVARSIYPETTIVRPAPMYGYEDRLLHRLAYPSNVVTSNHLQERLYPVHAIDVAMALERMLHDDTTAAETFELYGPTEYSMAELNELVEKEAMKKRGHVNVPKRILKPIATYANKFLWWPIHSGDEVEREFIDQTIDPMAKTFKDLDIEPVELKSLTYEYLKSYRSSSYYDLPPMSEKEKREEKKYLHVIDDQ